MVPRINKCDLYLLSAEAAYAEAECTYKNIPYDHEACMKQVFRLHEEAKQSLAELMARKYRGNNG